jgi:hypothetical protein
LLNDQSSAIHHALADRKKLARPLRILNEVPRPSIFVAAGTGTRKRRLPHNRIMPAIIATHEPAQTTVSMEAHSSAVGKVEAGTPFTARFWNPQASTWTKRLGRINAVETGEFIRIDAMEARDIVQGLPRLDGIDSRNWSSAGNAVPPQFVERTRTRDAAWSHRRRRGG